MCVFLCVWYLCAWRYLLLGTHWLHPQQSETPTLRAYLQAIADILKLGNLSYYEKPESSSEEEEDEEESDESDESDDSEAADDTDCEWLPSVDFGPVSITKATNSLRWKPTPLADALRETCYWFEDAWTTYPSMRPIQDFSREMKKALKRVYRPPE